MCNVQKVKVVEKDIMSIANFAKWRGKPPHVVQTAHGGGVAGSTCMYIYSYINMHK